MKYNHFFGKISLLLICAGFIFPACDKGPQMYVSSSENLVFDSFTTDSAFIYISSNVSWTVTVIQTEEWLKAEPPFGKGNATVALIAEENDEFIERIAYVAISGEGVNPDTIKVMQAPSIDVAQKITDQIFKKYCLDLFDSSQDGKISLKEARNTESKFGENDVIIYRYKILVKGMEITSLAGIEYFTKIRELHCEINDIEEINVSKNKELRVLNCSYNSNIDRIDVSELHRLTTLKVYNTNLTEIDVSNNVFLNELWIANNSITSLNISNNKELDLLQCNSNQISNLEVNNNPKLSNLYCANNRLNTLNLSANPNLVNLYCNDNQFTTLDVSNNKALQRLWCAQNKITNLNLANNTDLFELHCDINLLTSLDVTRNTRLKDLKCSSNHLKGTLDISKNKNLLFIDLQNNPELNTIYVWPDFDRHSDYYEKDDHAQWEVLD